MAWNAFGEEKFTGSPQRDRRLMVDRLRDMGIRDKRLLQALMTIPRHRFVREGDWEQAYANRPLPISEGQTISQPYIVALMTEALAIDDRQRVLEIGTGSGYQTAILAELAEEVYTMERSRQLLSQARQRLAAMGYQNVQFKYGDGTIGWPEHGPYDGIIATGAVPEPPPSLLSQLSVGGRLVIPSGGRRMQKLLLIERRRKGYSDRSLCDCSFLPLVGKEGWPEGERTYHR